MYKLKCEHCGHLNDVSNEYLTLCSHCGKKLGLSFTEWRKKNPLKSFDDYKKEVCIDEDLEKEKERQFKQSEKRRNNRLVIILVVVGILFGSLFTLYHFNKDTWLNKIVSLANTSDNVLTREWEKRAYDDMHLYIETPFKLDTLSMPVPDQIKPFIVAFSNYFYENEAGTFTIFISYFEFVEGLDLNVDNAIQGALSTLENQPGITDFTDASAPYDLPGRDAKIIVGSLKKYGIKMKYQMLSYIDDKSLTQIVISYHDNDEVAKEAANRILKSLKLLD